MDDTIVRQEPPVFARRAFVARYLIVHALVAASALGVYELLPVPGRLQSAVGLSLAVIACLLLIILPARDARRGGGVPVRVETMAGCFPARSGRMHLRPDEIWLDASVFAVRPLSSPWFLVPVVAALAGLGVLGALADRLLPLHLVLVGFELAGAFVLLQATCGPHRVVVPCRSIERARRDGDKLKLLVRVAPGWARLPTDEIRIESSVARIVFVLEHLDSCGVEVEPGKPFGT